MGLPEILESANEVLSPKSSGRGKSVEGGKPPRGDKKAKNVSASVGRKKYQEIEEDDLDGGLFETPLTPQQLKRKGELRLRGHLLIVLSKNVVMTTRTAILRWWVRTHKKFSKTILTNFVIKSQIQTQVAFWRFKWLAAPGKKKRRTWSKFMEQVAGLVEIVEKRQKARLIRNAFFRII